MLRPFKLLLFLFLIKEYVMSKISVKEFFWTNALRKIIKINSHPFAHFLPHSGYNPSIPELKPLPMGLCPSVKSEKDVKKYKILNVHMCVYNVCTYVHVCV